MKMLKLAWKNILYKPLSSILCWIGLFIGVGIISALLIFQENFEKQFSRNIDDIDMVIGAKGSPLQLILSAVFHIDSPTGNISEKEASRWMKHPLVEKAIPLAYGDSYSGTPIVGTNQEFLSHYSSELESGESFEHNFDVVLGSSIAKKYKLNIGNEFFSSHGNDEYGEEHTNQAYTVTGILKANGTVLDNLIVSNIESVRQIHDHGEEEHIDRLAEIEQADSHEEEHHEHGEDDHDHGEEGHSHAEEDEHAEHDHAENDELTAVLIKFRSPMGLVQIPRQVNEQSSLMAAVPAIEVNRLFTLFGVGIAVLRNVGAGIILLSAMIIFVSLYNSLKERKYELALMRAVGISRLRILWSLLVEGLVLSIAGIATGLLLSRVALASLSTTLENNYSLRWAQLWKLMPGEPLLIFGALLIGLLAALIPGLRIWSLNISKTLAHG
ncbi:ABC transporter permease [Jiulongibacter sp. NS-SX5]|uniref:ABC transporter permease n=1 Tax=Jiulongibacter sp. NS-SX5 TaxID=3463854 RepID=UPI004057F64B